MSDETDLPYTVELLGADGETVEELLARTASHRTAWAAYRAALVDHPTGLVMLRQRARVMARSDRAQAPTISRTGLARALARIVYELETIDEEGHDRAGNPTWYACDRLEAIRETALLAIEGNELACVGGTLRGSIDAPPEFFDAKQ